MSKEVEIFCYLPATTGKEDRLRQVLLDLAQKVQADEPGCTGYQVFESKSESGVLFNLLERWDSAAALHGHWEKPWLIEIRNTFDTEDLIIGGEKIKDVRVIGGFPDRRLLG